MSIKLPKLSSLMIIPINIAHYVSVASISFSSLVWLLLWITSTNPNNDSTYLLDKLFGTHLGSTFFRTDGYYGSAFLYQSLPLVIMAISAFAVIELRKIKTKPITTSSVKAKPNISTYPCITSSPLGVLTSAEVLGILGVLLLVTFSFATLMWSYLQQSKVQHDSKGQLVRIGRASYYMGRSSMIPFSLLWIPVSRGSPFLRLMNVPFEQAVKYHRWLSILTLFMLTLHSTGYIIYYVATHRTGKIIGWATEGESCSIVAGLVALVIGLVIGLTSMPCVRRKWYELFFGVHHLYIAFLLFWLYHVIWTVHFIAIPCLLFFVDRFLRHIQSHRSNVDVLSVKFYDSGAFEVRLATQQGLEYHALSSWYLRFPSLSRLMSLEWHFFSMASTPLDDRQELSFVIKPLGKWTRSLRDQLLESSQMLCQDGKQIVASSHRCPFSFKAGMEGPYGHESNFFLRYETLILIGGGIGVTPLLAIIQDIIHRKQESNVPTCIKLYYCVREQEELCILNMLREHNEHTTSNGDLALHIFTYVTSTSSLDYIYNDDTPKRRTISFTPKILPREHEIVSPSLDSYSSSILHRKTQGPLHIGATGSSPWVASMMFASVLGFYAFWGTTNIFIIKGAHSHFVNYHRAHIVITSMILGTTIFGGAIILLWWFYGTSLGTKSNYLKLCSFSDKKNHDLYVDHPWKATRQQLCSRPHWNDIFNGLNKEHQGKNIGVLVSGPQSMQKDVARECQKHTRVYGRDATSNVFHYHSVSFDL